MNKNETVKQKPELVIGLVARMGVDISSVLTALKSEAAKYNYKFVHIKVTDFLKLYFTTIISLISVVYFGDKRS